MLTEAKEERSTSEGQDRKRQSVRDHVKAKARGDLIITHKAAILDPAARERFEHLLAACEKDADEIACEGGEEASTEASGTEYSSVAYEVGYIRAYMEALPMLMATALARCDALEIAA
ncbi:hypothetical protein [Bradyrhizobium erythrophlei]|uniref:Uncharacterized protein n=1 Tax=Bradyrhizobium erythrophlei TaxID=1437360 RepID=A0A1M7ULR5_9BRAD|nr:hypothetical protein [Bradyrhizobium erythrophlei]SHN83890.1 hypothetical protein SAMN05444170_5698 [Bradyrhizobium erythrophlei]